MKGRNAARVRLLQLRMRRALRSSPRLAAKMADRFAQRRIEDGVRRMQRDAFRELIARGNSR